MLELMAGFVQELRNAGLPVSLTETCTSTSSAPRSCAWARTTISPRSVNLMALPTRFTSTCFMRTGSPITRSGTSCRTSQTSSSPFWCARSATVRSAESSSPRSSNPEESRSSRPASILEKSRMSLITESSVSAEERAVCR